MSKVLVPLADGFEDLEAVSVIDVLRRGGVEVVTAALGTTDEVRSAHGVRMHADGLLADVADADYDAIVLPGGGEGTENLRGSSRLRRRLVRQQSENRLICAICAAPTVLAEFGLLPDGCEATCYPSCADRLGRPCAGAPVVADGNIITGQAPGSALLFALVVLQTLEGESVAGQVAEGMVTDVL